MAEPEKVARRLAGQVDERRHPRTTATVDHLLDRHFELVTLERSTLAPTSVTSIRPGLKTERVGT